MATTDFGIIWNARNNAIRLELTKDDTVLTQTEIEAITKAEIKFNNTYYDSDTYASSWDLVTYKADGQIEFSFGLLGLTASTDRKAELIIYDAANTNGIVWTQGKIKVTDEAIV